MNRSQLLWLRLGVLSTLLTLIVACKLVENDRSRQHLPGGESAYNARLETGSAAKHFLSGERFKSLVIEIQAVQGHTPSIAALDRLKAFLLEHVDKPNGIEFVMNEPIPSPGNDAYTIVDVRRIEDTYRRIFSTKDRIAAYFLFLDGRSADDQGNRKLLGQTHRNTSVVIYQGTVRNLTKDAPEKPRWLVEATVMAHEFGHLLGLVNAGTTPQSDHQDEANGNHCANPTCLMFHAVESSEILQNFQGNSIPPLDLHCLHDLQAIRGETTGK